MMTTHKLRSSLYLGLAAFAAAASLPGAQPKITSPKEIVGFDIGADYHMANYTQISTMLKKWDAESDRVTVVGYGTSSEGRTQYMAIITSPENHKKLERYREISVKLARAEGLTDEEAQKLAKEGKAVVWIDGGLHSTETVNAQTLAEMVYQMASRTDEETLRFLDDVILLMPVPNPDGVELVANWYMRQEDEKQRSLNYLPVLYQKYVGHDNNRDSIMNNMVETTNQNRVLFIDWIPQIMHNVHQTGPLGQVVFIPPFRDPFNYNFDPLVPVGIEQVGAAMHARLLSKGMGGSAMRSAALYSTWWNGGMRTACYFHNQIGILTEIIGGPTPVPIALVPDKQLPQGDWPLPIKPQMWHYRQSIDYMIEIERAAVDYASKHREEVLYNIYGMGKRAIAKGSGDYWTVTPKRIAALVAAGEAAKKSQEAAGPGAGGPMNEELAAMLAFMGGRNPTVPAALYEKVLNDPAYRDPRVYVIPADQDDFATAVKFVNVLLKQGVFVEKASAPFKVGDKSYPAGSYVVKAAQAFRAEVMDMFEPQDHPVDLEYPGGPPKRPYDITGWTPAVQMGVQFDRFYDDVTGPFKRLDFVKEKPMPAAVAGVAKPAGYLVSHKINDAVVLTNRLLKAGAEVYWLKEEQTFEGKALGTGTLWIPASAKATPVIEASAKDLGVPAYGIAAAPKGEAFKLNPIRIGLVDLYGGVMPSGWTRWILEQYEFDFEIVFPQVLDAGNLRSAFDVIIVPSSTFSDGSRGRGRGARQPDPSTIPEEYRSMLGSMTTNKTIPPLKTFVAEGGTLLAIGSSATIGAAMGLPVKDHMVEVGADGKEKPIPSSKFYIPGSILKAKYNVKDPLAYGMNPEGYVFFDSSPVFKRDETAEIKASKVVWFEGKDNLYSGWAMGQEYLDGGELATNARVGKGSLVLIGLEATFRATPHATFKLFFNGLYYGTANETVLE